MPTRLRVVATICSCVLLGASAAAAQTSNDFFRRFNTIAPPAIVQATRAEWNKLPSRETACMEDAFHKQGGSVEALIQRGVAPTDSRIAAIRANCRVSSAQQTAQPPAGSAPGDVPVGNPQNQLTQLARAKADADAARQTAEQAAEKAKTDAEAARKGLEAAERDTRLARAEIERLKAETARLDATLHQLEANKVAADAKADTPESIFYWTTIILSIAFGAVTAWLVVMRKQMADMGAAATASAINLRTGADHSFAVEPPPISARFFEAPVSPGPPDAREPAAPLAADAREAATRLAADEPATGANKVRYRAIFARAGAQTIYTLVLYFLFLPMPISFAFLLLLFNSFPEATSSELKTLVSTSFMELVAASTKQ